MAKKTAIYIRISTQLQHSDRQKEELLKLAENEGYEVVDTYIDILSGFKDEEFRPELKRLLEDSESKRFEIILFSEFSRLSRTIADLNKFIVEFRKNNIELFFQKQNQWVKKKGDVGTNILIQILGVLSEYEIELFKERSISGKISAVKNRGINIGGLTAYGYKSEKDTKKLIIDEKEANIVKRIFKLYIEEKTTQYICDLLNSEKITSPYANRIPNSIKKRKEKGISQKDYKKFNVEDLVWVASSLTKILKNPLYTGKRCIKVKRENAEGEIVFENIELDRNESIRIIDDSLFQEVQEKLQENNLRKNTAVKHPSLLKSVLKCGCCGRNFVNSLANGTFRYMCYGKIKNTKTREVNCKTSLEYAQYKLDGLVIQMVLFRLADNNYQINISSKLSNLSVEIGELEVILSQKKGDFDSEEVRWGDYIKRASKFNVSDTIISSEADNHQILLNQLSNDINKIESKILYTRKQINSLNSINENKGIYSEMDKIINDKNLLKQLFNDFVEKVTTYPIYDKYSLIIVTLKDATEIWGTLKSSKYKNDELWLSSGTNSKPDYIYQLLNNEDKIAEYKPDTNTVLYFGKTKMQEYLIEPNDKIKFKTVPQNGKNPTIKMLEISPGENPKTIKIEVPYINIDKGEYPIKDFIELLKQNDMNGNFSSYNFHFDESDNEKNKLKDIEYRKKNAEKKNARAKELRINRKKL